MSPHTNKYIFLQKKNRLMVRWLFVLICCVATFSLTSPTNVSAHYVSIETSGLDTIDVSILGEGASLASEEVYASSSCMVSLVRVGIDLPSDKNLYKNGDSHASESSAIRPSAGRLDGEDTGPVSILGENRGTWGYYPSTFLGYGEEPSLEMGFFGDSGIINDDGGAPGVNYFTMYYGVSVTENQESGLYSFANDGAIVYYAVVDDSCNAYHIKYDGNDADNPEAMDVHYYINRSDLIGDDTTIDLVASNYQRDGYGFAGWSFVRLDPDSVDFQEELASAISSGLVFGPNETIDLAPDGLLYSYIEANYEDEGSWWGGNAEQVAYLYAVWVPSAGDMQNWGGCDGLSSGEITALTDTRDDNTYAIAKLEDDKCWIIENMRLGDDTDMALNSTTTNDPASSFVLLASQDQTNWCTSNTPQCLNQSLMLAENTINPVSNMTATSERVYSYGNYYNWYAATAGHGTFSKTSGDTDGDICPSGWHLPTGGVNGEYYALNDTLGGDTGEIGSSVLRSFPNNTIYAGYASRTPITSRGASGFYWTSTAYGGGGAYNFRIDSFSLVPGDGEEYGKSNGFMARCVASDSYTISYDANGGTGTMDDQTAFIDSHTELDSNSFTRTSRTFNGWNTAADGSGTSYANGASVSNLAAAGNTITLYAQWACAAGYICYDDNGANSPTTMGTEYVGPSATGIMLWPSNYQRSNYGFAGWNTSADGTGTNYGPMETIDNPTVLSTIQSSGLMLYAKWVQSAGNLQDWNGCSSLASGTVTALTDLRDNDTYAVAKLTDGNCWMIENLRLGGTNAIDSSVINPSTTNNPASGFTLSASQDPSVTAWCTDNNDSTCVNQSLVYAGNVINAASNMTNQDQNIYSYGNFYNWYTATAGNGTYSLSNTDAAGDICPKGWHLPSGGGTGEFALLSNSLGGFNNNGVAQTMDDSTSPTGAEMTKTVAVYPNNFVLSGYIYRNSHGSKDQMHYNSSSPNDNSSSYGFYNMTYGGSTFMPGNLASAKSNGRTVRCIAGS